MSRCIIIFTTVLVITTFAFIYLNPLSEALSIDKDQLKGCVFIIAAMIGINEVHQLQLQSVLNDVEKEIKDSLEEDAETALLVKTLKEKEHSDIYDIL